MHHEEKLEGTIGAEQWIHMGQGLHSARCSLAGGFWIRSSNVM